MASVSLFLHPAEWALTGCSACVWLVWGFCWAYACTLFSRIASFVEYGWEDTFVHLDFFVTGETEEGSHRIYRVTAGSRAGVESGPTLNYCWEPQAEGREGMNVGEASAGEEVAELCPLWWALPNGTEGGHLWHRLLSRVHLRVTLATFLPAGRRAPVFMVMF